jgi:DNA-binding response OmpR family regulator
MLNITIIEDHTALRRALEDVLRANGHRVTAYDSAEAMQAAADLDKIDILVLDLNLPGEDGISMAKRLRLARPGIGIVMLTARGAPSERQIGYDSGADIYLTKPSSGAELTAAINALARRIGQKAASAPEVVLDPRAMTLTGPQTTVALSASEVELLMAFAKAEDNRLHSSFIAGIGAGEAEITKATMEVRIVRLRKKLMTAGVASQPIKAVRNFGYQMSTTIALA